MRHTLISMGLGSLTVASVLLLAPNMPITPVQFAGLATVFFFSAAAIGHALRRGEP